MKQYFRIILFIFYFCCSFSLFAQSSFYFPEGVKKRTFSFKLINNLIVLPIQINGVALNFLLDSGVNKTILFNNDLISIHDFESREIINIRVFSNVAFIRAFRVEADFFKIDRLTSVNHEILLLEDENLKFSKRMGTQIDGILGASLFKNFKISINYISKRIRIEYSNDKTISCRKCSILPIRFKNKKPLVSGFITQDN